MLFPLYLSLSWPIGKFLGFILFLITLITGFWCLMFILFISAYWIIYGIAENNINLNIDREIVRSKKLYEQENVIVLYQKECS